MYTLNSRLAFVHQFQLLRDDVSLAACRHQFTSLSVSVPRSASSVLSTARPVSPA